MEEEHKIVNEILGLCVCGERLEYDWDEGWVHSEEKESNPKGDICDPPTPPSCGL